MINIGEKKRRGRPSKRDSRRYDINIRVNLHELGIVKRACNDLDMSMSGFIRMLIRDYER